MALNITRNNCLQVIEAQLCGLPCGWKSAIASAICAGVTSGTGVSGYSGYSGYSGGIGGDGQSGQSGYSGRGLSGYSGFSGISGYSGDNPGSSGISGYSGFSGANPGISGYSGYSGDNPGSSGYSGFSGEGPAITADNGLIMSTPTNVQLGSPNIPDAPLLHNTYIAGVYNLSLNEGTFTVGVTAPIIAKATIVTTDDYFSVLGRKQVNTSGDTGAGIAVDGQFLITGGTTYGADGPFGGLYGELGFLGSGNWTYTGSNKEMQLGGLSGVTTIYTADTSSYNSGVSIFSGGQYFLNAAGTGTIDKFASVRALYPLITPTLTFSGTITNHYAVLIEDYNNSPVAAFITNRWGVYQEGAVERNYFAGIVGCGISSGYTATRLEVMDNALAAATSMVYMSSSSSSANGVLLNVQAVGQTGGIISVSEDQTAITGSTTTATAIRAQSSSGAGLNASSITGLAASFSISPASTNTIVEVAHFSRSTSAPPVNGIGGSVGLYVEDSGGGAHIAGSFTAKWIDVTVGTRTSEISLTAVSSTAPVTVLTISAAGIFTLSQGLLDFADDTAAAIGGIPVNGLYRNGSVVQIRVT